MIVFFIHLAKSPISYIWKIEAPNKIKILIWLAYLDRLHAKEVKYNLEKICLPWM